MKERRQEPSPRQEKILGFIREYSRAHGYPPAIREIGSATGISSTSVVDYHLRALERMQLLRRDSDVSRGITLVGDDEGEVAGVPHVTQVPVAGLIAAGEPLDVLDSTGDLIALSDDLAEEGCYALRVRGKSMIDDHIDDGDLVVIAPRDTAPNGAIVVALVTDGVTGTGAATLKRLYREKGRIRLQPANSQMSPIYVDPSNVLIQGTVRAVIRRY